LNSSILSHGLELARPAAEPAMRVCRDGVLMVFTRDVRAADTAGRGPTLRAIIDAAGKCGAPKFFQLKSFMEQRAYLRFAARLARRIALSRRSARWPLQCVLFDDPKAIASLLGAIAAMKPAVVYFDGVRCYAAISAVRAAFPRLRIVCDFDDLMSRRLRIVRGLNQGFNLGYFRSFLPDWPARALGQKLVSAVVLEHEAATLRSTEEEILRTVENVTLVSCAEAALLSSSRTTSRRAKITVAPPPYISRFPLRMPQRPYRFVFIGSNSQLQNRLTIEWLLNVWRETRAPYPLHIYGNQVGPTARVENVVWEGFAKSLRDVYTPNSLLLAPAFLAGGLKTKICEALSYGVIPLGNDTAFEAIALREIGLTRPVQRLVETVHNLETELPDLLEHARRLHEYLSEAHAAGRFEATWKDLLFPDTACTGTR
jgi:hypothetical protein